MRYILIAIFISSLSAKNSQSFISAGIIHQNIDNYENSQALHICYSYIDFSKFGFDWGYVQSFYKSKSKKSRDEKNFSALYIFPTYLIPLNNSTAFKAKAGYAKNESGDDGIGYGVEIIFQVNRRSGFSLGFQKMNREINYFMLNTSI